MTSACAIGDTWHYLQKIPECNGKVGAVGYCLGGKLCYLMCCAPTSIARATTAPHRARIVEAKNLHRPFVLHMAMKDRWVQAEVNDMLERRLSPNPLVTIHKYPAPTTLRPPRRQDLFETEPIGFGTDRWISSRNIWAASASSSTLHRSPVSSSANADDPVFGELRRTVGPVVAGCRLRGHDNCDMIALWFDGIACIHE